MPCPAPVSIRHTLIFRLFFTTLLAITIIASFHVLPQVWAAEPYLPGVSGPENEVDWENAGPDISRPNAFQFDFFGNLEKFDQVYMEWQTKQTANARQWEDLAEKAFGKYDNMPPDGENGPFILRGKLIKGECHLFAAVDHMKKKQREKALKNYRKGLVLLQRVILQDEVLKTVSNKDLGLLPDYRYQLVSLIGKNTKIVHPYAGYEGVGTGLTDALYKGSWVGKIVAREISSTACGKYYETANDLCMLYQNLWAGLQRNKTAKTQDTRDLEKYYVDAVNGIVFQALRQKTSAETARYLLSEFCPWGIEMFLLMEKAELTKDLDFRILRPFSGSCQTFGEKLINGLKQFPDAVMGKPVASKDNIPPVISEMVIKTPVVPKHIYDEMHLIIGDRKQGYLDTIKRRPIKWEWVEKEPTYTIWFSSPAVFDWNPSDYFSAFLIALKSPDPLSIVADEGLNSLRDLVGSYYGKNGEVYCVANTFIENYDHGILYPGLYEKNEWLGTTDIVKKLGSMALIELEDKIREGLYGNKGLDPQRFRMGNTYDGGPVPPVIIRSEVMGFENVPEDEYIRNLCAVRLYLLYPENIANKGPDQGYDLSTRSSGGMKTLYREKEYLAEQNRFRPDGNTREPVRKLAWGKLPDPLRAYEVVTHFTPKKQDLVFYLTKATARDIRAMDGVYGELWTIGPENAERYARITFEYGKQEYLIKLYNKNNPDAVKEFNEFKIPKNTPKCGQAANLDEMKRIGRENAQRREALKNRTASSNILELKSQYELRVMSNGKSVSGPYRVVLERGRKNQRKITGKISSPDPGTVKLVYSPQIEIVKLKVNPGQLTPGKPAGETIPDQSRQRNN